MRHALVEKWRIVYEENTITCPGTAFCRLNFWWIVEGAVGQSRRSGAFLQSGRRADRYRPGYHRWTSGNEHRGAGVRWIDSSGRQRCATARNREELDDLQGPQDLHLHPSRCILDERN